MSRTTRLTAAFAASAMLAMTSLTGCTGAGEETPDAVPNGGQGTADAALPDVEIPTQEEADARAAEEITADNADEAFEQLQREIESEVEE